MKPVNLDGAADPVFSYDEYVAYLNSKAWDELRTKRLIFDDFQCQVCGSRSNLQVHHLCYPAHGNFGTEPIHDLITLCKNCHADIDNLRKGQVIEKRKSRVHAACWIRFKDRETYREESKAWLEQWLRENERSRGIFISLLIDEGQLKCETAHTVSLAAILKLRAKIGERRVAIKIN